MREKTMVTSAATERSRGGGRQPPHYDLRLFIAGNEPNSALARASLERICADYLAGNCRLDVIDVLQDFEPALKENILVTPALIVEQAGRRNVIFGNLTDVARVLTVLEIGSGR
jgi:circadian clock protein KaiB